MARTTCSPELAAAETISSVAAARLVATPMFPEKVSAIPQRMAVANASRSRHFKKLEGSVRRLEVQVRVRRVFWMRVIMIVIACVPALLSGSGCSHLVWLVHIDGDQV